MVLQSLFIGIIISAMELLKDGVSQEADLWKLIYQRVDKYGLQNSTLMNLLDVFNALDVSLNGLLTVGLTLSPLLTPLLSHHFDSLLRSLLPPQDKEVEPLTQYIRSIDSHNIISLFSQVNHLSLPVSLSLSHHISRLILRCQGTSTSQSLSTSSISSGSEIRCIKLAILSPKLNPPPPLPPPLCQQKIEQSTCAVLFYVDD
jgi:hypothetical protein